MAKNKKQFFKIKNRTLAIFYSIIAVALLIITGIMLKLNITSKTFIVVILIGAGFSLLSESLSKRFTKLSNLKRIRTLDIVSITVGAIDIFLALTAIFIHIQHIPALRNITVVMTILSIIFISIQIRI